MKRLYPRFSPLSVPQSWLRAGNGYLRWLILGLFVCLLSPDVAAGCPSDSLLLRDLTLFERTYTTTLTPGDTLIALPDSFIVVGSVRVRLDSVFLPDTCFRVDYRRSWVTLRCPHGGGQVQIRYRALNLPIPKAIQGLEYLRYAAGPRKAGSANLSGSAGGRGTTLWQPTPGLRQSGTIVRGLTIGTDRGLSLQSGLRMQLAGRLADKVEVSATLSDKNMPIQPQGNTQTLREIDNVFVQITSPGLEVVLGDFALEMRGGELDRLERKLQGIRATLRAAGSTVTAAGAVSRGRFATNRFMGREGVQGPYPLRSEDGRRDIVVIAGSERVWVDGELMQRGEDRDYVIDYSTGEITFTRRRVITDESRIVVDFQYSDEKYRRGLYLGRVEAGSPEGSAYVRATYVRESDDKENPISFSLDEERRTALKAAGDSPERAWLDGARYVGQGKGSYVRRDSIFEYVGDQRGDYEVTFSDVGEGKGDYAYAGVGRFRYVGRGKGRYLPVIALPLPTTSEQLTVAGGARLLAGARLETELAVSRFDRNAFSPVDDGDNLGAAGVVRLRVEPSTRWWGDWRWQGEARWVGARFHEIHRTQEAEYDRRWDLPDKEDRAETVLQTSGEVNLKWGFSTGAELGWIRKPSGLEARRADFSFRIERPGLPETQFRQELIRRALPVPSSRSRWVRRRGRSEWRLGRWAPSLEYEYEDKSETVVDTLLAGFAFERWKAGVAYRLPRGFAAGAYAEIRTDNRQRGGRRQRYSEAKTGQISLRYDRGRALLFDLSFIRRDRRYLWGDEGSRITDLIDLRAVARPLRGLLDLTWNYQGSRERVAKQERVFLRVEQGMGTYRYDSEYREYVPDPYGDYVLRLVPTDEYVPVTDLRSGLNLRADLSRLPEGVWATGGWSRLRNVSLESTLRVEEQTRYPRTSDVYLLHLARFRDPQYTVHGSLLRRFDIYYRRGRRDGSLRIRWLARDALSNQYTEVGQESVTRLASVLALLSPTDRLGLEVELESRREARRFLGPGRVNRDVRTRGLRSRLSYRWSRVLETGLGVEWRGGRDAVPSPPTRVRLLTLAPGLTVSLRNRGRAVGVVKWTSVGIEPSRRSIPYEMAGGLQAGRALEARVSAEYSLGKGVVASLQYLARSDPFRPRTVHRLQAEVRAFF